MAEVNRELPDRPNADFFTRHESLLVFTLVYFHVLVQGNDLPEMVILPSVVGLIRVGRTERNRGSSLVAQQVLAWVAFFASRFTWADPEATQVFIILRFVLWLVSFRTLMSEL